MDVCGDASQHSIVSAKHQLRRNEVLCLPKVKFKSLYIIESGALKAYQVDKQGNEYIQGFYFAGEVVGFKAIFHGHYLSTIAALMDTIVCEVHYDEFLSLLRQQPKLYEDLLLSLSKKLSDDACIHAQSAEQRIAMFLIDLSRRMMDADADIKLEMPMTREDVGHYLGLTAETVSRVLTRFQRNKIITVDRRTIYIHHQDKLKQISE
jgi:CRP/FNR family transcriptional regulator